MVTTLRTTPKGLVDAAEEASIAIYGYQSAMAERETARVQVEGGEVHLDIYAADERVDARTVVFVGGLSAHALAYAGFAAELRGRGHNVVGVDLRGHGRSSGRRGDLTVETAIADMAAAVEYARERFGGPVGFMGTSLGGFWALVASNALTTIDSTVCHWVMLPDMPVTKKDARMRPIARALMRVAPGFRMNTKSIAEWDHVCEDPALRQQMFDDPLMSWKYTVRALMSGVTYEPPRPLTELRCPTLIVVGECDQMTPLSYTREVYERLQGEKELHVVPNAAHMGGLVEHRDEMLDAVSGWFAKTLTPPARTSV